MLCSKALHRVLAEERFHTQAEPNINISADILNKGNDGVTSAELMVSVLLGRGALSRHKFLLEQEAVGLLRDSACRQHGWC